MHNAGSLPALLIKEYRHMLSFCLSPEYSGPIFYILIEVIYLLPMTIEVNFKNLKNDTNIVNMLSQLKTDFFPMS